MKRHSSKILAVISTILVSTAVIDTAAASSADASTPGQQPAAYVSSGPAMQRTQDRVRAYLAREVRHELIMLPYYGVFDWLQFEVQGDSEVILSGQVTRPTLKSDAERVVKEIEGVANVVNRIEVLPVSPNDDRIRRAVYRALFNFNSSLHRYGLGAVPSIHITVNNGQVTLKGVVDRQSDSNLAYIKARGVGGAFSVKNELRVGNS